jgi:hypothetical protein
MTVTSPIVIIETPYAGDIERNVAYARAALRDSLMRGESPYASHLLYTQPGVLRDDVLLERTVGIAAGFAFRYAAHVTAVYQDLGISSGMQQGILHAMSLPGHRVEYRNLPSNICAGCDCPEWLCAGAKQSACCPDCCHAKK